MIRDVFFVSLIPKYWITRVYPGRNAYPVLFLHYHSSTSPEISCYFLKRRVQLLVVAEEMWLKQMSPSKNSSCPCWVIDSIWAYHSHRSKDHTDYIISIEVAAIFRNASKLETIQVSFCILVPWFFWDIPLHCVESICFTGICDLPTLSQWIGRTGPGPTMSLDWAGRAHTCGPCIYDQWRVAACVQQWIWKASLMWCVWMFVDACGCVWMHVNVCGCMWMLVDARGCMLMHVDVYGRMWMYMVLWKG